MRAWGQSPLRLRLDAMCVSCFIGRAKPDPAACGSVLAALGVEAGRAAFVAHGGGGERRASFGLVVLVSGLALRRGLRDQERVAALAGEADADLAGVEDLAALLAGPR